MKAHGPLDASFAVKARVRCTVRIHPQASTSLCATSNFAPLAQYPQQTLSNLGKTLVVLDSNFCKHFLSMTVSIVLHVADEDLLLFAGQNSDCPPIPRVGDEIIHEERRVRLEGIRYQYQADHLEIGLLA